MEGRARQIALWAGVAAFFGNVVALKVAELITGSDWAKLAGGLVVSFFVAGTVYSKERLAAARRADKGGNAGAG